MIFTPKDDYQKFHLEIPEPGFSPERNKLVVENSIKKYEANQLAKKKKFRDQTFERADAIATYFQVIRQGRRMDLRKFFTPKYLAYLRGEEIRQEYMANLNFKGKKRDQILAFK